MADELLFDKSLQNMHIMFNFLGLNVNNRKKRNFKQNFIIVFNLLWLLTDCVCTLMQVLIGYRMGKVFTDLTYIAACFMYLFLAESRIFFFALEEKKIEVLISRLRTLEITANGFVNIKDHSLSQTDLKRLNTLIKALIIFNSVLFSLFDVFPLIFIAVQYLFTGKLKLVLPMLDSYPFDSLDIRYWPYAYIHQFWSACITLLGVCATDFFLYTCCTFIKIQFNFLQTQFRKIPYEKESLTDSIDFDIEYIDIPMKFRELIKWHQEIISAANLLKDIYSKSFLGNFMCSSLVICLTGFNVTFTEDKVQFITFMLQSLMQIFFLCLFGDILMSSSMKLSLAVYNSKWYRSDMAMRGKILMVLQRAQKPCQLTAAGFADVNLRSYMKILSTSWSYFALLQTIYTTVHTREYYM